MKTDIEIIEEEKKKLLDAIYDKQQEIEWEFMRLGF